jgi:hypothetical protein
VYAPKADRCVCPYGGNRVNCWKPYSNSVRIGTGLGPPNCYTWGTVQAGWCLTMKPVNSCAPDLPAMLPRQDNLVCEICAKVSLAMSPKGTDEGPDGRLLVHTSDRLKT